MTTNYYFSATVTSANVAFVSTSTFVAAIAPAKVRRAHFLPLLVLRAIVSMKHAAQSVANFIRKSFAIVVLLAVALASFALSIASVNLFADFLHAVGFNGFFAVLACIVFMLTAGVDLAAFVELNIIALLSRTSLFNAFEHCDLNNKQPFIAPFDVWHKIYKNAHKN